MYFTPSESFLGKKNKNDLIKFYKTKGKQLMKVKRDNLKTGS